MAPEYGQLEPKYDASVMDFDDFVDRFRTVVLGLIECAVGRRAGLRQRCAEMRHGRNDVS